MHVAFDRYRLELAFDRASTLAARASSHADSILTLDGDRKDLADSAPEFWVAIRETPDQFGPFFALRILADSLGGAAVALTLVPQTHRLFLGVGRHHWVIDLQMKNVLAYRVGSGIKEFHVFPDGVLAIDLGMLHFYAPTGKPRWQLALRMPWRYEFEAGNLRVIRGTQTHVFPLVSGPNA